MLFRGKPIQEITEADLLDLIGVTIESHDIDFKSKVYSPPLETELPTDQKERDRIKNKWKLDLCTDLAALANGYGGWIVCGVKEKGGIASDISGLGEAINLEEEIKRIRQTANAGVEPLIQGLLFHVIPLSDPIKNAVVVIEIPRSFRAPHRVKEIKRFAIRRSGGNDDMTIDELRAAFNLSESYVERIKAFRKSRVDAIAINGHEDVPVFLTSGVRMILHSVPLSFGNPSSSIDLSVFQQQPAKWVLDGNLLGLIDHGRFNLDGFVRPIGSVEGTYKVREYIQIYRTGAIEFVSVLPTNDDKQLELRHIEALCLNKLAEFLLIQLNLGIELPLALMLTLANVKGFRLISNIDNFNSPSAAENVTVINRDKAFIPDVLLNSFEDNLKLSLKPLFDILWNTGGWERSLSYDKDGNWIRK